jgi:hypothetical protein
MLVSELIKKIYIAYKGKDAQKAPQPGDKKYPVYLSNINDALDQWADMPYNWSTLFTELEANITDSKVELPSGFIRFTDKIFIDGKEFDLVDFNERFDHNECVYISGGNPKKVSVVSESQVESGSLSAGVILRPEHATDNSSLVICDNYRWLALTVAAIIASNDPAKDDMAGDLSAKAQIEFDLMVKNLNKKPRGYIRKTKSKHPPIGRTW